MDATGSFTYSGAKFHPFKCISKNINQDEVDNISASLSWNRGMGSRVSSGEKLIKLNIQPQYNNAMVS